MRWGVMKVRVNEHGEIVIPAELVEACGGHAGDAIVLRLEDGEIRALPLAEGIRRAQAWTRAHFPDDRSMVDELIAERRAEAARE